MQGKNLLYSPFKSQGGGISSLSAWSRVFMGWESSSGAVCCLRLRGGGAWPAGRKPTNILSSRLDWANWRQGGTAEQTAPPACNNKSVAAHFPSILTSQTRFSSDVITTVWFLSRQLLILNIHFSHSLHATYNNQNDHCYRLGWYWYKLRVVKKVAGIEFIVLWLISVT